MKKKWKTQCCTKRLPTWSFYILNEFKLFIKKLAQEREDFALMKFNEYALNILKEYPQCNVCKNESICPGFKPDEFRSMLCTFCQHLKEKHDQIVNGDGDIDVVAEHLESLSNILDLNLPGLDVFLEEFDEKNCDNFEENNEDNEN